ncbi:MAG: flavin reductase family protein [Gammaproteobacteria bacterium]|nr:flavin reductase family protein [Gammaproteobacteria bacterium]
MIIDLSTQSAAQVYFSLIQTVIPRPIARVLSENATAGSFNLAPFSYFNAVCSDPPLIMVSIGRKPDGSFKDTKVNIEERPAFVIHLVDETTLDAMNASSATLAYGESELAAAGLATTAFEGFSLPRPGPRQGRLRVPALPGDPVGATPQSLVLGQVERIFVDDSVVGEDGKGRAKVLAEKIRPLGRLGPNEYVTFGEIVRRVRPT